MQRRRFCNDGGQHANRGHWRVVANQRPGNRHDHDTRLGYHDDYGIDYCWNLCFPVDHFECALRGKH
jgi:hypothetical protein